MFIRVKKADMFAEDAIFVNHNCGIRLIAEYLKMKIYLPPEFELDLCHQCGYLIGMYNLNPTTNGLDILKNRTLYYMIRYEKNGANLSKIPIPCVGNQKLSLQIINQIKRNPGECRCLGEPSLIEFNLTGTEASVIEKAKRSSLEKQYTSDFFNRKTFSDLDIEEKVMEDLISKQLKSPRSSPRGSIHFPKFQPRKSLEKKKSVTA